jgi:hypothetical protein
MKSTTRTAGQPTTYPQHDAMSCERRVGTSLCPPYGLSWSAKIRPDCYPWSANLTARWQICGIFSAKSWQPRFSRNRSPPCIRREKTPPCRKRKMLASSLPQDSPAQLMFGAARFGEPGLRSSRGFGFRIAPRGRYSLHRLGNLRKWFNPRRISDAPRRCGSP